MPIVILSDQVISEIAAGEVIDRPANLAKELIENSIDAKATSVEIDIDAGGRFMKVSDDGCGVNFSDLKLVFARHATSKIRKSEDLYQLASYGFRGEALAAAAAVSRVKFISRAQGESQAYRLINNFGIMEEPLAVSGAVGSTIEIRDLFENVPARLKFLKSPAAEIGQIRQTIKALAMTAPQVEFRLREAGKLSEFWPRCSGLGERFGDILDTKAFRYWREEQDGASLELVLGDPMETVKSGRNIWCFVNQRWINDKALVTALLEGYRSLLMHHEFPRAAISLHLPGSEVDVNVHPTKSQVKFLNPQNVFRWIYNSTKSGLGASVPPQAGLSSTSRSQSETFYKVNAPLLSVGSPSLVSSSPSFVSSSRSEASSSPSLFWNSPSLALNARSDVSPSPSDVTPSRSVPEKMEWGRWDSLSILGQAKQTYIVCQGPEGLILIDQHAAHERVAYERLMASWMRSKVQVQPLLVPLALDVEAAQIQKLESVLPTLGQVGLEVEVAGPGTLLVRAIPAGFSEEVVVSNLHAWLCGIDERVFESSYEKMLSDLCATWACHSVVRAGQVLRLEQMRELLTAMDEFPHSSFCPHGRPVYVTIPWRKLEVDFGRIV